jgi:hypothetical protein
LKKKLRVFDIETQAVYEFEVDDKGYVKKIRRASK